MEQIAIGTSGLRTSRWPRHLGDRRLAAVARGVRLIDTAPVYGFGRSEEIVGKALAEGGLRETVQIATKLGVDWKDGKVFRDSRPTRVRQEIEDSLRRLRTDIIDLYQLHWPDLETPIAETAQTLEDLRCEGKILGAGKNKDVGLFSAGIFR